LRFQPVQEIKQQRVGINALPGLAGDNKESLSVIQLFIDRANCGRIGAIQDKHFSISLFRAILLWAVQLSQASARTIERVVPYFSLPKWNFPPAWGIVEIQVFSRSLDGQ
jgi:hypothetical protein